MWFDCLLLIPNVNLALLNNFDQTITIKKLYELGI